MEAPFSPDTHILTDLGCEPSDEESRVEETSQGGTFLVLSPCAGDRGLQRLLTVRETREEERRGAEKKKNAREGEWVWGVVLGARKITKCSFASDAPAFPSCLLKLSLLTVILLLPNPGPFWGHCSF